MGVGIPIVGRVVRFHYAEQVTSSLLELLTLTWELKYESNPQVVASKLD
jgi:hypothetical protein